MPSFQQILDDPVLLKEEIERVRALDALARRDGHLLDTCAEYLQVLTDKRDGIDRCYACGRKRRKDRGKPKVRP
jgi:hypothetical protein